LFAYRLAKDLGLKVEDILTMNQAEFTGWAAFYKIESEETRKAMDKAKRRP
jgi:hypothetical protein